jgi:hypothetical protein
MSVIMTRDRVGDIQASLRALMKKEVLVGIPAEDAQRREPGSNEPINNALIGYWMEYGVPSRNVPARPSLIPGVQSVSDKVAAQLVGAIRALVAPQENQVDADGRLAAAGMVASSGVKNYINAGVGPALSEYTLKKRAARGRVGAQQELDNRANIPNYVPGLDLAKPLVDTAQFRNAITYVVRTR